MRKLETIVIPSGNFKDDVERFDEAMKYIRTLVKQDKKFRYILSGIGPDLNERLAQENRFGKDFFGPFEGTNGLDVHPELWSRAVEEARRSYGDAGTVYPFGVDVLSRNSVENIVNTFPRRTEGYYKIFSRKLHNFRFKLIEKIARDENYLSEYFLKINYFDTEHKYSVIGFAKDVIHLMKDVFFGKKKVKRTIAKLE